MLTIFTTVYLAVSLLNSQYQPMGINPTVESTNMTQLDSINKLLDQFVQTKTVQNLVDANREMKQLPSPTLNDSSLPERAKTWFKIIALVDANKNLHLTKDDRAYTNVPVPGEGGKMYPSGTDPKDVKDPATRAAYIQAINENKIKSQRAYQQSQMIGLDRELTSMMPIYLKGYFKTPSEQEEVKRLISQSQLSEARKKAFLDVFK
jgi:hypothetical protein